MNKAETSEYRESCKFVKDILEYKILKYNSKTTSVELNCGDLKINSDNGAVYINLFTNTSINVEEYVNIIQSVCIKNNLILGYTDKKTLSYNKSKELSNKRYKLLLVVHSDKFWAKNTIYKKYFLN